MLCIHSIVALSNYAVNAQDTMNGGPTCSSYRLILTINFQLNWLAYSTWLTDLDLYAFIAYNAVHVAVLLERAIIGLRD